MPHNAFLFQNDSYADGSQFSDYEKDMSSKLIGFDLSEAIRKVDENLQIPRTSDRNKNIIGTIKGIGGGKTRILEELRQHYLKSKDVLILSITYNILWEPQTNDLRYNKKFGVCLAVSIIARMASVLFGVKINNIIRDILDQDLNFLSSIEIEFFIRKCIQCFVNKVRKTRDVRKFILSIDEL